MAVRFSDRIFLMFLRLRKKNAFLLMDVLV